MEAVPKTRRGRKSKNKATDENIELVDTADDVEEQVSKPVKLKKVKTPMELSSSDVKLLDSIRIKLIKLREAELDYKNTLSLLGQ